MKFIFALLYKGTPPLVRFPASQAKHTHRKRSFPLPSRGSAFTLLWRLGRIGEFRSLRRATNAPRVGSAPPFEKGGRKLLRRHRREVPDKSKFEYKKDREFSVLFDSKHINHQECHEGEADTDDTFGVYLLFKYEGSHEERKHYRTALI